jgi:hypothetical protein
MTQHNVLATEKALLFVAIGYLEALKSGAVAFDEVFHTIGVPKICDRMRESGISRPVADLICSLDELDPEGWDGAYDAIEGVLKECRDLLAARPLTEDRANVCLKLLQPDQIDR